MSLQSSLRVIAMISASACGIFQFVIAPNTLDLAGANLDTFIGATSLALPLIATGVLIVPAIIGAITYLMVSHKPKTREQLIQEYLLK